MSTYHHGDLRAALLRGAAKILETQGIPALSLRDAARRAGVSHSAPYRHFPDREALLAALAAEGFELLGEAMRGHSGREMGEAYVRFALAHPQRFRLMFGGTVPMAKHAALRGAAAATHRTLVGAFSDLPRPQLAAAAAWSLVHGLSHLLLDGHFESAGNVEQFAAQVIGAVRFASGQRAT
ncbi:MAG TPA: TetR/AcrR family transcriptional regulator [Burkholderiales bacterium]|nr:TetR/AcrR family transcriptional regulator [Burkholderiales bacterium]